MPSYTELAILQMDQGSEENNWGNQTNTNWAAITQAISNTYATSAFTSGDVTLTWSTTTNADQDARNMRIVCNGTPGIPRTLTVPAPDPTKIYIVENNIGYDLTVKALGQVTDLIVVPDGKSALLYCDGAKVISPISYLKEPTIDSPALTGTPTAPTALIGTSSTQIASTAFVSAAISALGSMSNQNANGVNITGGTITGVPADFTSGTIDNVTATNLLDLTVNNTSSVILSVGTTAQRPVTPLVGMFRMNTSTGEPEWYDATNSRWVPFSNVPQTLDIQYFIVGGGGGGGGYYYAGGGGAGGVLSGSALLNIGSNYIVNVGAGGAGGTAAYSYSNGQNGQPSSIGTLIAAGGGGGGSYNDRVLGLGNDGGCGGGNSGYYPADNSFNGGYNIRGHGMQGFHGGYGGGYGGGGGGGAGSNGINGGSVNGGAGGSGIANPLVPTTNIYAVGGGGGAYTGSGGPSGSGGYGGTGGSSASPSGTNATINTGSGGGGGAGASGAGGSGSSGIVFIRYYGATPRATGGTITTVTFGTSVYTLHTFTSGGTFAVTA